MNKKELGSYYTPLEISEFMVKYCFRKLKSKTISVLEPSVGDGSFLEALNIVISKKKNMQVDLDIVEIEKSEFKKAKNKINESLFCSVAAYNRDFLDFVSHNKQKYSLIIGNPPYIKRTHLSTGQLKACRNIHRNSKLADKKINNIWTSFVVASLSMLDDNGVMAFVLPSDILQVKYAEEIRVLLEKEFERLEIFTLDEKAFSNIDQQTVILFAHKKSKEKGVFFFKIDDYASARTRQISSNGLLISDSKWTHYLLSEKEIQLLNFINNKLPKVSDIVSSSPGIVTGANDYFILSKKIKDEYNLDDFCKPIIPKSMFVDDDIELTKRIFNEIVEEDKPSFLLSLFDTVEEKPSKTNRLNEYLNIDSSFEIRKRYKCVNRKEWYMVPNIGKPASAFFFRRMHQIPKLVKNSANVYVTDSAYNIYMKENYKLNDFVYSFYNIVTLIFAELLGRKYGGGVLELSPREFKSLPILYQKVSSGKFVTFTKQFKTDYAKAIEKKSEVDVINNLKISKKEFEILVNVYSKLLADRLSLTPS